MKRIVFRSRAVSALCAVCGGCRGGMRIARAIVFLIPIITIIPSVSSCRKDAPPQPYVHTIELEALDVSCTEAWLKITLTDFNEPRTVKLTRDDSVTVFSSITLRTSDTLVVDEGLLPNRTYTYRAYRLADSRLIDSTTQATLTTMDTTSHNWVFDQPVLLGDGSSSVLLDVAIINDTLAYAVGEIYKRDSLGNWDPQPYGLAIWNGRFWSLRKIMVVSQQGDTHSRVLRGVYAFSATDVWFGDGNAFHWDGQSTFATAYWISGYPGNPTPVLGPNQGVHKFWGTSSSNLYGVGVNGGIAHYDGVRWRRIESGTGLPIWDVHGARDDGTGEHEIICVASNHNFPEGRKLLRIQGTNVTALPDSGLPWSIDAIWFVPGRKYIVVGDGVYYTNRLGSIWRLMPDLPYLYTTSIAASTFNDIIIGGAFWNLLHFNGSTLHSYFSFASGSFTSVAIKGNLVVAVGGASGRAIATKGTRQ
jgi:hypothetical protein